VERRSNGKRTTRSGSGSSSSSSSSGGGRGDVITEVLHSFLTLSCRFLPSHNMNDSSSSGSSSSSSSSSSRPIRLRISINQQHLLAWGGVSDVSITLS